MSIVSPHANEQIAFLFTSKHVFIISVYSWKSISFKRIIFFFSSHFYSLYKRQLGRYQRGDVRGNVKQMTQSRNLTFG